jgi:hypothetical protein
MFDKNHTIESCKYSWMINTKFKENYSPVFLHRYANILCCAHRPRQRVQRLINIKIAKAYRTISFEASCMMAGVPPIRILTEKAKLYK